MFPEMDPGLATPYCLRRRINIEISADAYMRLHYLGILLQMRTGRSKPPKLSDCIEFGLGLIPIDMLIEEQKKNVHTLDKQQLNLLPKIASISIGGREPGVRPDGDSPVLPGTV